MLDLLILSDIGIKQFKSFRQHAKKIHRQNGLVKKICGTHNFVCHLNGLKKKKNYDNL